MVLQIDAVRGVITVMRFCSILLASLGSAFLLNGGAGAHPCQTGSAVTGTIVPDGTSDGFALLGEERSFVLAGLVFEQVVDVPEGEVKLYPAREHLDRYGRLPVFVFLGGQFLQETLLDHGKALADPRDLNRVCALMLLAAEPAGIVVRTDDLEGLASRVGHFAAVRGRVLSIGDRERVLYLNFGGNWAQDFTVSVAKLGRNRYQGDIEALHDLVGHEITVRGTLEERRGPLLRLTDEQRLQRHD
jgi:hypothetical protein